MKEKRAVNSLTYFQSTDATVIIGMKNDNVVPFYLGYLLLISSSISSSPRLINANLSHYWMSYDDDMNIIMNMNIMMNELRLNDRQY